jgi:DNA-3-methyladenine glycosylase I
MALAARKSCHVIKNRCFGNGPGKEFYADYHDTQWGVPVHNDELLFEMLILEGAQAGLSWETILKRRAGYQQAFHHFNVLKVAHMSDAELESLRTDERIIRNRLKIYSARKNAQVFLKIQQEFGTFNTYLWQFVDNKSIKNRWGSLHEIPARTTLSDIISKDLKRRGMSFVGSTIIYAYVQAIGMVNDHVTTCWLYHTR